MATRLAVACAALALPGAHRAASAADHAPVPASELWFEVRGALPPAGELVEPTSLSAAPDGSVYVVDEGAGRIQRFDASGLLLGMWGRHGRAEGEFGASVGDVAPADAPDAGSAPPCGGSDVAEDLAPDPGAAARWLSATSLRSVVAVGPTGVVYVSDLPNLRIQKFTSDGLFYAQWRAVAGSMTLAPDGTLFATDPTDGKVKRYCPAGRPMGAWGADGEPGACSRISEHPSPIAVTSRFTVVVAHRGIGRVEHCTVDGALIDGWNLDVPGWSGDMVLAPGDELLFTGVGPEGIQRTDLEGERLGGFGSAGDGDAEVPEGSRISAALDGSVFVLAPSGVVKRFAPGGGFAAGWGARGTGVGQLRGPWGVAAEADGSVLVVDRGNHRLQRFARTGHVLSVWGGRGSETGELLDPSDVAVEPDGPVVVSDTGNARIVMFDAEGVPVRSWSETDMGPLLRPVGISVGPNGTVYVADADLHRVARFGRDGAPRSSIGSPGSGEGELDRPHDVAVSADGTVFVADTGNARVQVFSPEGAHMATWPAAESGGTTGFEPVSIAVDDDGLVWVTDAATARILAYDPHSGTRVATLGGPDTALGELAAPYGVAATEDGLLVAEAGADRVRHLAADGELVAEWGTDATDLGRFDDPTDIAVTRDGRLLVADAALDRIQSLDAAGRPLQQWSAASPARGEAVDPVAIAAGGTIAVVGGDGSVMSFDSDGAPLAVWTAGAARPEIRGAAAAAFGADGLLAVTFGAADRIAVFGPDLDLLGLWGASGPDEGQMDRPRGIAPLEAGFLVAESGNDRLQGFSRGGESHGIWGGPGTEPGRFVRPHALAATAGTVYVADEGNDRLQALDTEGAPLSEWPYPRPRRVAALEDRLWVLGGTDAPRRDRPGPTGGNAPLVAAHGTGTRPEWRVTTFANAWLVGPAVQVVLTDTVAFEVGGPLGSGLPRGRASARFERASELERGLYEIELEARGGVRLWIGDRLAVDEWTAAEVNAREAWFEVGPAAVRMDFRGPESGSVRLELRRLPGSATTAYLPSAAAGGR